MKKAAIHITIETVIIVILAIVFLGLAITFMAYIYKEMGLDVSDLFGSLKKQRIEQLKTSEKDFDLELYSADIKPGDKRTIFMLLRNSANEDNYKWQIQHSVTNGTGEIDCSLVSFDYKESMDVLPGNEATAPFVIQADKKINKGTCFFEIKATDSNNHIETLEFTVNVI